MRTVNQWWKCTLDRLAERDMLPDWPIVVWLAVMGIAGVALYLGAGALVKSCAAVLR